MEDRHIIAYALCAIMVMILVAITVRYMNNRKQFKVRQSGRGKSNGAMTSDGVPAE